jgi:HK97 family phage prohead protease
METTHIRRALKASGDQGPFSGYGSIFGNVDLHGDIVEKGAFTETLKERPIEHVGLYWMHDPREPIGKWSIMEEREQGLWVEGKLTLGVSRAREVYELMKDGAVTGLSIGYRTRKYDLDGENDIRILKDVELFEVSAVSGPANEEARIAGVKSAKDFANLATVREANQALRDAGFSQREANAFISRVKSFGQRDVDNEELIRAIDGARSALK